MQVGDLVKQDVWGIGIITSIINDFDIEVFLLGYGEIFRFKNNELEVIGEL